MAEIQRSDEAVLLELVPGYDELHPVEAPEVRGDLLRVVYPGGVGEDGEGFDVEGQLVPVPVHYPTPQDVDPVSLPEELLAPLPKPLRVELDVEDA